VVAHQHLAFLQVRRIAGDQHEVAGDGLTAGAVVEEDLLVDGHESLLWCCGAAAVSAAFLLLI
jgi:hypothetical protein